MDLFGAPEIETKPQPEEAKVVSEVVKYSDIVDSDERVIEITNQDHHEEFTKITRLFTMEKLHHCTILYGIKGIGKMDLAIDIAKFILSDKSLASQSKNLALVDAGHHPDLFILSNESSIGVDEARKINHFTAMKPTYGRSKIVIINKIDYLNRQACNAILKLLEEPQSDIYYILISDNLSKIIPTIKSRSIAINVQNGKINKFFQTEPIKSLDLQDAKLLKDFSHCSINGAIKLIDDKILDHLGFILDLSISKNLNPVEIEKYFNKLEISDANLFTILLYTASIYNPLRDQRVLLPTSCKSSDQINEFLKKNRNRTANQVASKYFQTHSDMLQMIGQKKIFNLDNSHLIHAALIKIRSTF